MPASHSITVIKREWKKLWNSIYWQGKTASEYGFKAKLYSSCFNRVPLTYTRPWCHILLNVFICFICLLDCLSHDSCR